MITRRDFLKSAGAAGTGLLLPWSTFKSRGAEIPGGTLDPATLPKYVTPLVIPPAMPRTSQLNRGAKAIDYYEIAIRQFRQQILPAGSPDTTVWGYGSVNHPGTFNYPGFTIETTANTPVRVKWINQLIDASGNYLPHLLAVDPTLHWANPPGPRDTRPTFRKNVRPGPYTGPVPMVTHLHGGHSTEESDGYAEAWFLPRARNIPRGYFTSGTWYEAFKAKSEELLGQQWEAGSMLAEYANDQRPTTAWYHDHTLGMTRLNVYAGPAGFYLIRGQNDPTERVLPGAVTGGTNAGQYEIPIAIQDRAFNLDGSLFYPPNRKFFDGFSGPYIPQSDISPIWNPEFFGNAIVVNGKTWPNLNVEPRRYRFRLLDGCNARFLLLKLVTDPLAPRPVTPVLPFVQIGTEGGFLPAPVLQQQLLMAPAERADVIVDFTGLPVGTELYLINEGPDEPFAGGLPYEDFEPSDPATTGQVMKFTVVPLTDKDRSAPVNELELPSFAGLGQETRIRKVTLNEASSAVLKNVGPQSALLGTLDEQGFPVALQWMDEITENPIAGEVELWEIYNFTADAHPIHLHEVQFQVVNRQQLVTDAEGMTLAPARVAGPATGPEPWEAGYKDTVIAYPGQVTRIRVMFDIPGLFVWHCHIVEHEDNEMMRPLIVQSPG